MSSCQQLRKPLKEKQDLENRQRWKLEHILQIESDSSDDEVNDKARQLDSMVNIGASTGAKGDGKGISRPKRAHKEW